MKISSFNPMILSSNTDEIIDLFEELGFEKHHSPSVNTGNSEITTTVMKDEHGNHIDIAGVNSLPRDMTIIRMNVDNFEEAYEWLVSKGFKNSRGDDHVVETDSNKSALMISPFGFAFDLCHHKK